MPSRYETEERLKSEAEAENRKSKLPAKGIQRGQNTPRDAYIQAIRQKVERNWIRPSGSEEMPPCEVKVLQGPGGIILDVTFGSCSGSTSTYRASIESAVYRAEPLPKSAEPEFFDREIALIFNPDEPSKRERSADEIERVFQKNKGSIFNLYNRALRKNPSLSGQVVFRLTISSDGYITATKVLSSELDDETLERKLLERIKKFKFPNSNVRETIVTYPIDFRPS